MFVLVGQIYFDQKELKKIVNEEHYLFYTAKLLGEKDACQEHKFSCKNVIGYVLCKISNI